jgi:hypothetical protein
VPREKPSARLYRACTLTGVPPFAALATMPRRTSSLVWFAGRRNPRLAVVPVRVLAAAAAVPVVARRIVSRPARARALARLARLAARGPAAAPPESHRSHQRAAQGCRRGSHTLVVVAPVAAHVVISHRRHAATPLVAAAAATLTCVAIVTAHVIVAHPNRAVVSRVAPRRLRLAPRASNLTSVTIVVFANSLATRTTHVCTPARLAGAGVSRLTSSRAPRRRATPCRRRRRSPAAATVALHTAATVVAAAATRALKARTPSLLRVALCSPRLSPLCIQRPAAPLRRCCRRRRPRRLRP